MNFANGSIWNVKEKGVQIEMASSSNLKEKKTRHAPTARQKSTRTAGRVVAPAASIVPAGTIANKDAPEKSLVLRAPLNREHALKSLDETVANSGRVRKRSPVSLSYSNSGRQSWQPNGVVKVKLRQGTRFHRTSLDAIEFLKQ